MTTSGIQNIKRQTYLPLMPRPEAFLQRTNMTGYTQGRDGKHCTAKSLYVMSWIVIMLKLLISGISYNGLVTTAADLTGMAALLTVTAATYYGRSRTKADNV